MGNHGLVLATLAVALYMASIETPGVFLVGYAFDPKSIVVQIMLHLLFNFLLIVNTY